MIKSGIINISSSFCSIKRCLIAGSNRYATEDVLAANNKVKKIEIDIFDKYFFV